MVNYSFEIRISRDFLFLLFRKFEYWLVFETKSYSRVLCFEYQRELFLGTSVLKAGVLIMYEGLLFQGSFEKPLGKCALNEIGS